MIGSQFNVRMLWRICSVLDPGNVNKLLSWSQHWTNLQTWRFFSLRIIVLSLTHFHHIQSIDNNIQSRNETEIIWSSFLLEQDSHSQLKRIQNIFGWTAPTSRPAFTPLAPVWEKLTKAYSVRLSSTLLLLLLLLLLLQLVVVESSIRLTVFFHSSVHVKSINQNFQQKTRELITHQHFFPDLVFVVLPELQFVNCYWKVKITLMMMMMSVSELQL